MSGDDDADADGHDHHHNHHQQPMTVDAPPRRSTLVRSRIFERERDDASTDGPLRRCLEWVGEQQPDRTFVVLSHELSERARSYEAMDETHMRRWAEARNVQRRAHELIWTSTKLYVDVDAVWSLNPNVEATVHAFIDQLEMEAQRQFSVQTRRTVLDASRQGEKFSRHIIIEMRDDCDGELRNFATARHCGAFVRALEQRLGLDTALVRHDADGTERRVPLCDHGVYKRNQTLRTLGSDKTGANRPLRLLVEREGDVDAADTEYSMNADVFVRTLITMPRVTNPHHFVAVNEEELARVGASPATSRKRTHTARPSSAGGFEVAAPESLARAIEQFEPIASCGIRSIRANADASTLVVNCSARFCELIGRKHRSHTAYFVVNVRRGQFSRRCHDPECRTVTWAAMDVTAPTALRGSSPLASSSLASSSSSSSDSSSGTQPPNRTASAPPTYGPALRSLFSDFSRSTEMRRSGHLNN